MLEYVKNCRVCGVTMLNTNVGKNVENDQNMLEYVGICWNMLEYVGIC